MTAEAATPREATCHCGQLKVTTTGEPFAVSIWEHVFHFCPDCGSQVFYTEPTEPDLVVVSVGSFADPAFPPPTESGYDARRHRWVQLPASIRRA